MAKKPDEPNKLAMEEWRLLQDIIGRLEGNEIKIRGWSLAFNAVIFGAWLTKDLFTSRWGLLVIGALGTLVFFVLELIQRIPKRKAIERARAVEETLGPNKQEYTGPQISHSLSRDNRSECDYCKEVCTPPMKGFLLAMSLFYVIVSLITVLTPH